VQAKFLGMLPLTGLSEQANPALRFTDRQVLLELDSVAEEIFHAVVKKNPS
jgi:hypothetical protein